MGSVAVVVAVAGSLLLLTSCDAAAPAGTATPATSGTTAATPTPSAGSVSAPIAIPPASLGELARSVARSDSITSTRSARARGAQEYVVRGQCQAWGNNDSLTYSVEVDGADFGSGELPCGGPVMVNSLGPVKAGASVAIALAPSSNSTIETAYVIVVPAP